MVSWEFTILRNHYLSIKQFMGVIRFYAIYVQQREHLLLLHITCTTLPLTHMSELLKARLSESYQSLTI